MPNLVVVALMVALFGLAIAIPMPGRRPEPEEQGHGLERPVNDR